VTTTEVEDLLPFADAAFQNDPYPYYRRVRDLSPVYESPFGVHAVTRHADIFRLLRDSRLSARQLDFGVAEIFHDSVLGQDSPDHARLRKISAAWFTPDLVQRWTQVMRQHVDAALDRAAQAGGLDIVDDLSFPATFGTMAHILGVDVHEAHTARQMTLDIGRALRPAATEDDVAGARDAFRWYVDYINDLIAAKRRNPGDGMLDAFLAAEAAGTMTSAEVMATVTLFYAVGHLDNSFLIQNGIRLLLDRPDVGALFVQQPDQRMQLLAEILRYDTPEQFTTRYVTEDIDVDGDVLPQGAIVLLMIGSGNRDERQFSEPDDFVTDRPDVQRKHLAFGGGQHGCAGQVLARAQGDLSIASFLQRFPHARIDGEVEVANTEFIRGIRHLPVSIH
jgi:cytochrome P450